MWLLLLQGLTFPLLENANEWIVHGFAYNDYLKELDPPTQIGRVGGSLDKAFASEWTIVCLHHLQWLRGLWFYGLAITLAATACHRGLGCS